jgi:hypothetical protein
MNVNLDFHEEKNWLYFRPHSIEILATSLPQPFIFGQGEASQTCLETR